MTFKRGQSGNPNGRPKGIIDKRSELRGLLEPHIGEILDKLIQLAKAGDPNALKLCIERLLPRAHLVSSINIELPEDALSSYDDLIVVNHIIAKSVASGEMTIDDADKFCSLLSRQFNLIQSAERIKMSRIRNSLMNFNEDV